MDTPRVILACLIIKCLTPGPSPKHLPHMYESIGSNKQNAGEKKEGDEEQIQKLNE